MARGKHLSLADRNNIQFGLDKGLTFTQISREFGLDRSCISKEVKHRSDYYKTGTYGAHHNNCSKFNECRIKNLCQFCDKITRGNLNPQCRSCVKCNDKCYDYSPVECELLKKSPHVCNGCMKKKRCRYTKRIYLANYANTNKEKEYKETHKGIYITKEELKLLNDTLSKYVKENGHSVHAVSVNHPDELIRSEKTIYNYINGGLLPNVKRIDLPRAVRYRQRKDNCIEHKVDKACRIGRTLEDFEKFMNGSNHYVEGDTVEGRKGGKCITTLIFKPLPLQLAFIKNHNTSEETIKLIDYLYDTLGRELYMKLFYVLLLDNGSEFSNPKAIEFDENGNRRSYVFYCDAKHSEQKGSCEKNHEEIRKIIPKGTSMDDFTQDDINLVMLDVNSYPRKKLNDITPYNAFSSIYGNDILPKFGITKVSPDDVILKPSLLKK